MYIYKGSERSIFSTQIWSKTGQKRLKMEFLWKNWLFRPILISKCVHKDKISVIFDDIHHLALRMRLRPQGEGVKMDFLFLIEYFWAV